MDYRNVAENPKYLEEMLQLSGGERDIPLIQSRNQLSIGWEGKS